MATTFEKTWAFSLNNAYAPASAVDLTRYTMWCHCAMLTGNMGGLTQGLWTLYASSDSVTAGTDATDRWVLAGPYDGTKIVRGAAAAIHSWIVLKSPSMNGANWYMICSFNTASDASIRMSFTKTAPTGGSTTVTPTAADQWWPTATTLAAGDWTVNAAAADASRFSMGLTSAGDWYMVGLKQGANVCNLLWQFHALSNKKTADVYPVWAQGQYLAAGVGRYAAAGGPFDITGSAGVGGTTTRKFEGTATAYSNPIAGWEFSSAGTATIWAPAVIDVVDAATYADLPVWIGHGVVGAQPTGIRGRVADLAIAPNTPATLADGVTTSPVGGPVDSIKVGNLWLPANAALTM